MRLPIESPARLKIPIKPGYGWGKLLLEIFEKTVEATLVQPTFITAYPTEVSPLARASDHDAEVTDRFEGRLADAQGAIISHRGRYLTRFQGLSHQEALGACHAMHAHRLACEVERG